jgi:RHS repeat-associated protein
VVDGSNRRVGKKVNGTLVKGWLYADQLRPIVELDGSGSVVARFVYGAGGGAPDYMIRGNNTYRFVKDHLGGVRLVLDAASGAVAQRLDYDAFGRVMLDTSPGFQPFGFAGGLYDYQTGLVRFGFRDYDSEMGRWTNKDPIGFRGGDSNLYSYSGSDPVNYLDPTGLASGFCAWSVSGANIVAGSAEGFVWLDTQGNYGLGGSLGGGGGMAAPGISATVGVHMANGSELAGEGGQATISGAVVTGSLTRSGTDYWGVEGGVGGGFGAMGLDTYTWIDQRGNLVEDASRFWEKTKQAGKMVWDVLNKLVDPDTYNPWSQPEGCDECE